MRLTLLELFKMICSETKWFNFNVNMFIEILSVMLITVLTANTILLTLKKLVQRW